MTFNDEALAALGNLSTVQDTLDRAGKILIAVRDAEHVTAHAQKQLKEVTTQLETQRSALHVATEQVIAAKEKANSIIARAEKASTDLRAAAQEEAARVRAQAWAEIDKKSVALAEETRKVETLVHLAKVELANTQAATNTLLEQQKNAREALASLKATLG